jgi:hypothetical protein
MKSSGADRVSMGFTMPSTHVPVKPASHPQITGQRFFTADYADCADEKRRERTRIAVLGSSGNIEKLDIPPFLSICAPAACGAIVGTDEYSGCGTQPALGPEAEGAGLWFAHGMGTNLAQTHRRRRAGPRIAS